MIVFLLLIILSPSHTIAANKQATLVYTLKDLEVLFTQQSYQELMDHASDIRPSKRDNHWKSMTIKSAQEITKSLLLDKIITPEEFKITEALANWNHIREDPFFQENRAKIGVNYFENCFKSKEESCFVKIRQFWALNKLNHRLGVQLAYIVQGTSKPHKVAPYEFIKDALLNEYAEFYCQKSHVKKIAISEISKNILPDMNSKEIRFKLSSLIHPDCYKSLKTDFQKALSSTNVRVSTLSYQILEAFNGLSPEQSDLFYTEYFLNSKSTGELFNKSWNKINQLGQDYGKREKILKVFKTYETLPDGLFGIYDEEKKLIMLDFLSKNFPEYLDLYAKTCLSYLTGEKKYKKGNPTIHCSNFFKTAQEKNLISNAMIEKFKKIPRYQ